MLLVSSIVTYQVQFDEEVDKQKNPKIIAWLNIDADGKLCIDKDLHWIGIPLKASLL
jgi:hypothetical protein